MDNGVFGLAGQSAQLPVGRDLKPEREFVIIRRKSQKEGVVRVTGLRRKNANVPLAKQKNQVSLKLFSLYTPNNKTGEARE